MEGLVRLPVNPLAAGLGAARPRRETKSEQAYQRLRRMIVTLEVEPGSLLDESFLVQKLGLGRTPIREAIQRLALERLVVAEPGRTPLAAPIDLAEFQQIFEYRTVLERHSARLAAERMTEAEINAAREGVNAQDACAAANDPSGCIEQDYRFHQRLAIGSRNRYLAEGVERINSLSLRLWFLSFSRVGQLDAAPVEHSAILEAIEARDPGRAEEAMAYHIGRFRARVKSVL